MRKIDESKITSGKEMFFKKGTWTHLQKSYKEITEETIKSLIGSSYDATKVYVLNGCVNSGSGSSFNISAGSVFYGGEVYLVDATTFTTSGGNVAVGTRTTTNNTTDYSADPCLFTDGTYENVHNIRKFVIASGASGSGTKNYSDFVIYSFSKNYVDVSSAVSVDASLTVTTKSVKIYFDGTVQVTCSLTYSGTLTANTVMLTGLPLGNALYTVVPCYLQATGVNSFANVVHTGLGDTLINPDALSNTYDIVHFNYFYKLG